MSIHRDVMYAGNAGAFTGSPCGSSCGRSNVLSIGHPGLAKNSGVSHPGKRVQQVNVPLAHLQFLFHPDKFVELGSHPGLEKTIMHKKRVNVWQTTHGSSFLTKLDQHSRVTGDRCYRVSLQVRPTTV